MSKRDCKERLAEALKTLVDMRGHMLAREVAELIEELISIKTQDCKDINPE